MCRYYYFKILLFILLLIDGKQGKQGRGQVEKVDLLRYFWKIDLEKIYFFDLYFCFLKAFFGLKYTS